MKIMSWTWCVIWEYAVASAHMPLYFPTNKSVKKLSTDIVCELAYVLSLYCPQSDCSIRWSCDNSIPAINKEHTGNSLSVSSPVGQLCTLEKNCICKNMTALVLYAGLVLQRTIVNCAEKLSGTIYYQTVVWLSNGSVEQLISHKIESLTYTLKFTAKNATNTTASYNFCSYRFILRDVSCPPPPPR